MEEINRIHFIAIGGSIMHNLAIALHRQGHLVTGSDDVIYGISKRKLEAEGLMPRELGWDPVQIESDIDIVILGMHAKVDNPELIEAQKIGLRIYSFPEYIAAQTQNKTRIVVAGSHGKTTTTSMIMHILKDQGLEFDYLVGAQLDNFDLMVKLSDAPIIVIEGDEYLSSAIDRRPKFLHYNADYTVVTGVAWDHANVFPTTENYQDQFVQLLTSLNSNSKIYYDSTDTDLVRIVNGADDIDSLGYLGLKGSGMVVSHEDVEYTMQVFGNHNRKNMHAALLVCRDLGIDTTMALKSMQSFAGASMRQDVVRQTNPRVYRDFGHAPSKVKATIEAVVENHPNQRIGVFVELHTYSSMVDTFIVNYADVFNNVDYASICFDEAAYSLKRVVVLSDEKIKSAFNAPNADIIKSREQLLKKVEINSDLDVLLFLSSGNLLGFDLEDFFN